MKITGHDGRPVSLLTTGNPKIAKGLAHGFLTAILHLAPAKLSGRNVCQFATAECIAACLNTAGRGGIFRKGETTNAIQRARIRRTRLFFDEFESFEYLLIREIDRHISLAKRHGLTPAVRLNGTSDIPWERVNFPSVSGSVFSAFPRLQFYDYSKRPDRVELPANYHMTFSRSGQNDEHVSQAFRRGQNVAAVFAERLPGMFQGRPVYNGDMSDLRFLDPPGHWVGLLAKGRARGQASAFVITAHL